MNSAARTTGPARDPELGRRLLPLVVRSLAGSAFEPRSRWSRSVVVLRQEDKRVTSRACHAAWLAANDLPTLARECMARQIPTGCILVFVDVDVPDVAATGFLVFDLAHALKGPR